MTALRPLERRRPTLLRLRTARSDWFVDTRRSVDTRDAPRQRAPRGAAILHVPPRYQAGNSILPRTQRIPATDPERTVPRRQPRLPRAPDLRSRPHVHGARRVPAAGAGRRAPGAHDLARPHAAAAGRRGRADRRGRRARRRSSSCASQAAAQGAGVLRVAVDQGGAVTRVDADTVPGLATRGRGTVRVPLGGAPTAQVRVVDAAGNASAPVALDLATLPGRRRSDRDVRPAARRLRRGGHPAGRRAGGDGDGPHRPGAGRRAGRVRVGPRGRSVARRRRRRGRRLRGLVARAGGGSLHTPAEGARRPGGRTGSTT